MKNYRTPLFSLLLILAFGCLTVAFKSPNLNSTFSIAGIAPGDTTEAIGDGYVYIRVFEACTGSVASKIIITNGEGTSDVVMLERPRPPHHPENIDNPKKIVIELNKIKAKGYRLVTSEGSSNMWGAITNYIFEKE